MINGVIDVHMKKGEYDVYQYEYFFQFKDKVYISCIENDDLINLEYIDNKFNAPYNSFLAGVIDYEKRISDNYLIDLFAKELRIHVEKIYKKKVKGLSFSDPDGGQDIWINKQERHEYNPTHNHGGKLSFVYYVKIPEEIRNESKNQISSGKSKGLIQFNSERTNGMMLFNPIPGDIFIFESSHLHQVYPFTSDDNRISVAGNIHNIFFEE